MYLSRLELCAAFQKANEYEAHAKFRSSMGFKPCFHRIEFAAGLGG